ncbi:rhodanese-like domain-containing protein [Roseomonas sp. CCTCC AB2023176]|uniref:rhodanese-like domain-containing protein n=1 Tax=Roseomonas sp. CCTCC AB2023176 TaxID=3342640 RepID=UPI0035DB68E7
MRRIDAPTLKGWIRDGGELAILDAREDGEFGRAHLFWAAPCGLARAELRVPQILPRRGVRVCCVDGGEGHAERLAATLEGAGYSDVSVLDGGTPAWRAAGYVVFSGVNVPSKAFGEWVEHHYGTPSVDPQELRAMVDGGEELVILDSRPMDEFRRMSIPGGIDVPGGELVYRVGALVPDPRTTIVVNCAGRTRSIMGAESLRSAGVPNKVVALRNGTMGWELAGFSCDRGRTETYAPGVPAGAETALERARAFAARHGVQDVDAMGLAAMRADASRTTLLLDVRSAEEFAAGHVPGALHAPGGQLVQATDNWVVVRGSRVVLVDGAAFGAADGVRARMAGGWLRQMGGWEVFVLTKAPTAVEAGPVRSPCPEAEAVSVRMVSPRDLPAGTAVVDLARSVAFRDGHAPGALWGIRTRLGVLAGRLRGAGTIAVTAPDDRLARLAVPELRALAPSAEIVVVPGGAAAWTATGIPLEADRRNPPDTDCADFYLRPYDRNDGVEAAMRQYLSWEVDLVHEVARDGDARFGEAE